MNLRVETIDDFLLNPIEFRELALRAPFYDIRGPDGAFYRHISVRPSDEFEPSLSERLGRKVKVGYSLLRLGFGGEILDTSIHSDIGYDEYAAVLYLNPPEQCRGGTAFWRHRETGFTNFPDESEIRRIGKSPQRVCDKLHGNRNEPGAWEQIHLAEMKFNRAICYSTKAFHSRWPLEAFGDTRETARMIVAMFFSFVK